MNFDKFFERTYDKRNYTCANFVVDVWKELKKEDLSLALVGPTAVDGSHRLDGHTKELLERIPEAVDPCIALFQTPGKFSHVGIYVGGKLLSLSEEGVTWADISITAKQFKRVRFYNVKKTNNC